MTTWATLANEVTLDISGLSQPLAEQMVRDAAIEFCERSQIHIVALPAINVVAGTAAYTLTSSVTGTEVSMVRNAWYDGYPLEMGSTDILASFSSDWRDDSGTPRAYTMYSPDQLTLYPNPDTSVTGGLKVEVALRPTLASTELTTWIATKYLKEISAGAHALLFNMAGKPWSNPQAAYQHRMCFMQGISAAAAAALRGNTRAAISVRPRPAVR